MPTTITMPMPISVLSEDDLTALTVRLDNIEAFLRQAFTLPANAPIMPQAQAPRNMPPLGARDPDELPPGP